MLASLAWVAFVLTQTVGDPGRGEAVAAAVLADPDARAEVTAPVTRAVMSTVGVPAAQRPLVESQVDQILQSPDGSRAFIDPFAGSWARLLGEDDPRSTEFDLAPLLARFVAESGTTPDVVNFPDRLPVPGVPLPRAQLEWMDGFRSAFAAAVLPLALTATLLFAVGFAMGERARVLRSIGIWAILAGGSWIVVPLVLVWAARRWAPGADAVVAAALDEATSGLFVVAVVLAVAGALTFAASFAVPSPTHATRPAQPVPRRRRFATPDAAHSRTAPVPWTPPPPRTTAEMPATSRPDAPPVGTTAEWPIEPPPEPRPVESGEVDDDDQDSLWEYYS